MDIILYNIALGFCALIVGYFFGSIPVGVIIGKVFFHKDPRELGSKNSGGTNVGRVFGKPAGVACIAFDMIKTLIPLFLSWLFIKKLHIFSFNMFGLDNFYVYFAGIGALVGHCYPIFAQFRGGKAVASLFGIIAFTSWLTFIFSVATFVIVLKIKRYVSLASIVSSLVAALVSWAMFVLKISVPEMLQNIGMYGVEGSFFVAGWEYAIMVTIGAALSVVRHRKNIVRLINKEEPKVSWIS